jgi:hypothetical protein
MGTEIYDRDGGELVPADLHIDHQPWHLNVFCARYHVLSALCRSASKRDRRQLYRRELHWFLVGPFAASGRISAAGTGDLFTADQGGSPTDPPVPPASGARQVGWAARIARGVRASSCVDNLPA